MPTATIEQTRKATEVKGGVHCAICTHTVQAIVSYGPRGAKVTPGQRCLRCSSSLDAGYVLYVDRAA
jgi:hypothetical protein